MSSNNLNNAVLDYLKTNHTCTATKSNHATKILNEILRKCKNIKLPLIDRKRFFMQLNDFTLFLFNDVSLTHLSARVSKHQNSVRHEPMHKRKNVKLQINLCNSLKTVATKLQGNNGANTSATG